MKEAKLISYSDELYHHGIKGQKWGVKNGPPYPLDDSDHSASEKKAGWRKSLDKSESDKQNKDEKRGLTDKQKKAIKIGAAVAATALVAISTYKLADSGELHRLIEKGKAALGKTDGIGFKRNPDLAKPMSADEILTNVVSRINMDHNIVGAASIGTNNNCKRCTYAYELSRRGYNVKATKSISGTGQHIYGAYNATHDDSLGGPMKRIVGALKGDERILERVRNPLGGTPIKIQSSSPSESVFSALSSNPNSSRGELVMRWKGGSGHSMAWEIVNGKPILYDCQHCLMFDTPEKFKVFADKIQEVAFQRLDNVDLNLDFLQRWCENTKW